MILMIDNYDSFTYNLVQMFQVTGENVQVWRNDQTDLSAMVSFRPSAILISPGPGTPNQAGMSVEAIRGFGPKIPSLIFHDGRSIYQGLPNPFEAIRYHSLIVDADSVPGCLEISAWTEEGEIMGLRHRKYEVEGVQFHPESILTDCGSHIIKNFMHINKRRN